MKKIAIFVEGQTEQVFINKLLIEIAGVKKVAIELKKFRGRLVGKTTADIIPKTLAQPINPQHGVLLYDCGGDGGVKSRIREEYQDLVNDGYLEVIGIRDLFPLTIDELQKLEKMLPKGLPNNTSIIVAVMEIEAWFLSECNHFKYIDTKLTDSFIKLNKSVLGFDPYIDDMTLRRQPSQDLKCIYQLIGKTYNKRKDNVERTVECLDYTNIYIVIRNKITKLNELISKIDAFLI